MVSTVALVTLEDYLATSYRLDREWIDGELKERNVGKWEHARVQALLAAWFVQNEAAWGFRQGLDRESRSRLAGSGSPM
jgi:hypothetical protein